METALNEKALQKLDPTRKTLYPNCSFLFHGIIMDRRW